MVVLNEKSAEDHCETIRWIAQRILASIGDAGEGTLPIAFEKACGLIAILWATNKDPSAQAFMKEVLGRGLSASELGSNVQVMRELMVAADQASGTDGIPASRTLQ